MKCPTSLGRVTLTYASFRAGTESAGLGLARDQRRGAGTEVPIRVQVTLKEGIRLVRRDRASPEKGLG